MLPSTERWLEHNSTETLLIALTDGELAWDEAAGDFFARREKNPLPPALTKRFANEPKWVDLRPYREGADKRDAKFTELAADFAASIRGMPKEDLLSQEVRQQRRSLMLAWSAAATLLVFAVAAATAGMLAYNAEQQAKQERDRALRALDRVDRTSMGVSINYFSSSAGTEPIFANKCYYYGDGGYLISLSDSYLDRYSRRGFSRNSLCMALVSGILFDPESGKRLATYLKSDPSVGPQSVEGDIADELPLEIPDCFGSGLPYSSCEMRYDLWTGKKLSDEQSAVYRDLGAAIERLMRTAISEGVVCELETTCNISTFLDDEPLIKGFLAAKGYSLFDLSDKIIGRLPAITDAMIQLSRVSFYDVSPAFPKGFGYAVGAYGEASGPETKAQDLLDRLKKPK
jgi:hypothetical protein